MEGSSRSPSSDLRGGTDAELTLRSQGEPEVFAEIFERHAPAIYHYVQRRLGAAIADDVVSETFLVAFRQRNRYDRSRADARPWLYGIASNHVRRYRRAELRAYGVMARLGRDPLEDQQTRTNEADAGHDIPSLSRQLADALKRLHTRDRDVLLLIAWAELSYEEVAEALNIPVGTVRSRLHRARIIIRTALSENAPKPAEEHSHG